MKTLLRLYLCVPLWFAVTPGVFLFEAKGAIPSDLKKIRIGLVLDKGGKDDQSFNSAALRGAKEAEKELGAVVKYVEATDDNAIEYLLRSLVQKKYDIIIGVGVAQEEGMKRVAAQFPEQRFVIIDTEVKAPNVRSLLFQEHEGSYLVGAIAALTSKKGVIGFIGGMDIPLIRRFEMGYTAGAKAVKPAAKVVLNYADSWNNTAKVKEIALTQYNSGVEVIFAAAGASNFGLFDAAKEKNKFAIGVDSNQNNLMPGHILTSMIKRVDRAVFTACKEAAEGKFTPGTYRYGLADQGVDYSVDSYNEKILPADVRVRVEKLKKDIISGKIQVPDYYKTRK
jgi:basic membrane protein A and related proteins